MAILVKNLAEGDRPAGSVRRCERCRELFFGRSDARFCSDRCRVNWAGFGAFIPDEPVKLTRADLVAGEPCPLCDKKVGLSSTERSRRYRARKAGS